EIVEGIYRTGLQLHMSDAPLWVEATPSGKGVHLTLPCQWPAHVRNSVAVALSLPVRAIHLACTPPSGNRDAAVVVPAILAVIAAAIAYRRGEPLRLALRHDQSFLTGGRAPAVTQWASGLDEGGRVLTNTVRITLNHGAYPILNDETKERLRVAATSIYDPGGIDHTSVLTSTRDVPMSGFEGIGSAQLSFAREVHWNRLAEIAGQDPILWRRRHLRKEWPVVAEICGTIAAEADFHRRYSANELIRKRRVQLPRDSAALRGIGFALSDQQSGFTEARENGAVTVGLNQDGTAHLYCSVPTPTERLKTAWQQIVAQELGIERDAVILDTSFDSNQHDSGPRLFSRGVTLVPRAIISACQALQKQRFREPLPITVRRTLRGGRGTRTPVDALRSIGATAVEAILRPASMEIDIRSVTMVIYAGRVIDRAMAEAELRRGIYHALNWTLHESLLDAELVTEKETLQTYNTAFRGAVPKIRIVFVNQIRRDGPVGISELPFNTVPAALVSALSQATGLYLDSLPVQPAQILRLLQED
ncbi:MAG: molybdopterin cofactor-binding domain-containing protein, partial [Alkalispirochaeta sp.]